MHHQHKCKIVVCTMSRVKILTELNRTIITMSRVKILTLFFELNGTPN